MEQLIPDLCYEICRHVKKEDMISVGGINSLLRDILLNWRIDIDDEDAEKRRISVWQMLGYRDQVVKKSETEKIEFFVLCLVQGCYMHDHEFVDFALLKLSQLTPLKKLKTHLQEKESTLIGDLLKWNNLTLIKQFSQFIDIDWEHGFVQACGFDDIEIIEYFLSHSNPNTPNLLKMGFMSACQYEALKVIDYFYKHNKYDWEIGLYMASQHGSVKMAKMMLERGAQNYKESLKAAKKKGYNEIVALLKPLVK